MRGNSFRWLFVVVIVPLAVLVWTTDVARAQGIIDQPASSPTAQSRPDDVREWQAELARTLVSIQNALPRQETPPATLLTVAGELGRLIAVITMYVVGLMALLWALSRCLRLVPRTGTLVSFEDLSAPRSDRQEKSRILTQSILDLLQNPRPVQMSDLQMDIMPGADEPGFGNLQPAITMVSVTGYEPSENPMKIGMVEFSIRDLQAFFSRFVTRPHTQHLEGWLVAEDGEFEAGARLLNVARKPVLKPRGQLRKVEMDFELPNRRDQTESVGGEADSPFEWRVRRGGDGARFEAVADLAAKILVDTGKSTLTKNWQSFRCFNRALSLRDDQEALTPRNDDFRDGRSRLAEARGHLERAVAHDPSNWIARFSLALTLSRDDEAEVALKHLVMLEKVVSKAWPLVGINRDSQRYQELRAEQPTFCSVIDHLKDYPECAFLVLYNKAIALQNVVCTSLAGRTDALEQAARIFAQISRLDANRSVDLDEPYPAIAKCQWLSERSRVELSLYALSALADLLADPAGIVLTPRESDRNLKRAEQIKSIYRDVENLCERKQEEHWRSFQTARAVTLTAHAFALEREGQFDGARDALISALAAEPRFIKASLRLAELYLKRREPGWHEEAKSILEHVLEINPSCEQAMTLLKNLSVSPVAAAAISS